MLGTFTTIEAHAAEAASAAGANTFTIAEFRVLGNHVLAPRVIERTVYPFLGPDRTIDTVKQAADALEKAYKDAGYGAIYVDIPEQEVADGLVRLKVTEGKLEQVHVRGDRYFSNRQILASLPALEVGKTPNLPAFQAQITALNAVTPDRTTTPVLKAGSEPGTVDVDLDVKDSLPLHGSLQYDNRHTADTTPNRATVALSYGNLWQRQDTFALEYETAPAKPSDAEVFMASYLAHVGSAGGEAAFSYTHTSSDVLALGTLGVLGRGSIYGVHWNQPLVSTATSLQNLSAGADYKDVLTNVLPDSTVGSTSGAVTAKVEYVNWSVGYSGTWWHGLQTYSVSGAINFGIRSSLNSIDQFENARYNANPDYFYVRGGFNGTQPLPFGMAFYERINGQWADSPLVNNEQFSLGGADTVRGYLEAETLGDSGVAATIEVHSPRVGARAGRILSPLYGFVFVDGGDSVINDPLPAQRANVTLWSTGIGLRLENAHGWIGSVDYAIPERNGLRTLKDQHRIDFSVQYAF
jgi:hemolysin activation/secretion protein